MAISLISLNIERNKHLKKIELFLKEQQADVVCLQEVFERDRSLVEKFGYEWAFLPMTLDEYSPNVHLPFGIAICTKNKPIKIDTHYYHILSDTLKFFNAKDKIDTVRHGVVCVTVQYGNIKYTILTTHFTWTPDGHSNDQQYENIESLFSYTKNLPPHVLCGDFNVPRGYNDIYERLTKVYVDAIPSKYESSIDLSFHHNGKDPVEAEKMSGFMVDYVFTQSPYTASNVRLVSGVSDHCAVTATVTKE